jgi:hypothetical protein
MWISILWHRRHVQERLWSQLQLWVQGGLQQPSQHDHNALLSQL